MNKEEILNKIREEIEKHESDMDYEFGSYNHGYEVALLTIKGYVNQLSYMLRLNIKK